MVKAMLSPFRWVIFHVSLRPSSRLRHLIFFIVFEMHTVHTSSKQKNISPEEIIKKHSLSRRITRFYWESIQSYSCDNKLFNCKLNYILQNVRKIPKGKEKREEDVNIKQRNNYLIVIHIPFIFKWRNHKKEIWSNSGE